MDLRAETVAQLRAIVGDRNVVDDAGDNEKHIADWRGRYRGATFCVVHPRGAADVAAVVRYCRAARIAVIPQGGNTGMSAGALPPPALANVVLCLDRMNRVLGVDRQNSSLAAEAGCTLVAIQEAAEATGLFFPLALGSQGSCQIGGNVATNAGGTAVLRYGNMRELVLGLEVVLPDGRLWNGLRGLRKDNTGYDIKQLFIGAEGTLGIVTAVVLKLHPRPRTRCAAWVGFDTLDQALELLGRLRAGCGERLSSFEVMSRGQLDLVLNHVPGTRDPLERASPWTALIEAADSLSVSNLADYLHETLATALDDGLLRDAVVASNEQQVGSFWKLRESVSEANRKSGYSVSHDTSVPLGKIPEFVSLATVAIQELQPRALVVAVGHVGDGNIHLVLILPRDGFTPAQLQAQADEVGVAVHRIAVGLGGSISAEHGIGSVKVDELRQYKDAVELDLMAGLKRQLDPENLMNPGKILDLPSGALPAG